MSTATTAQSLVSTTEGTDPTELTPPREMSSVENWLRISTGLFLLGVLTVIFMVMLVPFIPFRATRIRIGNFYGTVVGKSIAWLSGTKVEVHGYKEGVAAGPAIYIANHVTPLDVFTGIWMSPPGCSGVAKKEIIHYPFIGQMYWLAGHLRIDRGSREKAVASLKALSSFVLKHKLSIWIWPEGTRSRDGRLLKFKKGVAHLALATKRHPRRTPRLGQRRSSAEEGARPHRLPRAHRYERLDGRDHRGTPPRDGGGLRRSPRRRPEAARLGARPGRLSSGGERVESSRDEMRSRHVTTAQRIVRGGAAAAVGLLVLFALEGWMDDGGTAKTAIVLGNQVYPDGEPSARLRARLDTAIALFRAGRVEQILVSGGTGHGGINEAEVMAAYVKRQVAAPVLIDPIGNTTRDTARNAATLLATEEPVIAVTQFFHVARSRLALRQAGFVEVGGAAPSFVEWRDFYSLPRDALAYLAYATRLR
jgi:1-acyl-sn-glycerol-3-phosphate acyltransferase